MYNVKWTKRTSLSSPHARRIKYNSSICGKSFLHFLPHAHTLYFGNCRIPYFIEQDRHLFEINLKHTCVGGKKYFRTWASYYAPFSSRRFKLILFLQRESTRIKYHELYFVKFNCFHLTWKLKVLISKTLLWGAPFKLTF